ncbi:MAG: hypothetical protein ACJA16_004278 [Akkermansiaceae bacterium]|jgi:hypothetical protein
MSIVVPIENSELTLRREERRRQSAVMGHIEQTCEVTVGMKRRGSST